MLGNLFKKLRKSKREEICADTTEDTPMIKKTIRPLFPDDSIYGNNNKIKFTSAIADACDSCSETIVE